MRTTRRSIKELGRPQLHIRHRILTAQTRVTRSLHLGSWLIVLVTITTRKAGKSRASTKYSSTIVNLIWIRAGPLWITTNLNSLTEAWMKTYFSITAHLTQSNLKEHVHSEKRLELLSKTQEMWLWAVRRSQVRASCKEQRNLKIRTNWQIRSFKISWISPQTWTNTTRRRIYKFKQLVTLTSSRNRC